MPVEARIRVLKCILDSRFGGPHRRSYAMADRLRGEGVDTVFLFGRKEEEQLPRDGFDCFHLSHLQFMRRRHPVANLLAFLCFLPLNVARIRHLIRAERIDVVDVDGVTNLVPALAAARQRVPIVWHYNDHPPLAVKRLLLSVVTRLSAAVIVQGRCLRESRTRSRAALYRKTCVVYPGVDTRTFDPARYDAETRAKLRRDVGVPSTGPLVGTIANLNRFKGHIYLLQAARRIRESCPEARFIVVGRELDTDPSYAERLRRLTRDLGLEQDVVFTGFRSDIPAVLAALDVFVLPSILESCPNVVLEAMAMEVPVVATDVGAAAELVLDGRTGLIVPAADAEALAEAVLNILARSQEEIRGMTCAARKRVESTFEVGRIVRRQKRLYEAAGRRTASETASG